jgi:hypothetical protein
MLIRWHAVQLHGSSLHRSENAANKVKCQVEKSAAALLLEPRIGEHFDSIVTGTSKKGTWVQLLSMPVESKLVQGFKGSVRGNWGIVC